MPDPAAAATDAADSSYPAFVRTADEIEVRVQLLIAQLIHHPRDKRRAHAH